MGQHGGNEKSRSIGKIKSAFPHVDVQRWKALGDRRIQAKMWFREEAWNCIAKLQM